MKINHIIALCTAETPCTSLLPGVSPPFRAAAAIAHAPILSNEASNASSPKKPRCFQPQPDATLSDSTVFQIRGFKPTVIPGADDRGSTRAILPLSPVLCLTITIQMSTMWQSDKINGGENERHRVRVHSSHYVFQASWR